MFGRLRINSGGKTGSGASGDPICFLQSWNLTIGNEWSRHAKQDILCTLYEAYVRSKEDGEFLKGGRVSPARLYLPQNIGVAPRGWREAMSAQ